ncbi:GTP-binding protein [Streptomyces sp. NPDC090135]|uniref:GTP-binding protein n=1 Tax=Streptomyces sp. NPDC090135 TaxID=3365957 RepID=UPI0037F74DD6
MNDVQHLKVAVIGHEDHGKTALALALEAYCHRHSSKGYKIFENLDRVSEEGGIPVDSNVVVATPRYTYRLMDYASHADVIKGISAAAPWDGALLVVSVMDGPMSQTREHLALAQKAHIRNICVFLNQCDKVDDQGMVDLIDEEVRQLLTEYGYNGDEVVVVHGSATEALDDRLEWDAKAGELLTALDIQIGALVQASGRS